VGRARPQGPGNPGCNRWESPSAHGRYAAETRAETARAPRDLEIIVRSNLTIIESHPRFYDLPEWFAAHRIRVVSSLPHPSAERTDRQRGAGVYEASLKAIRRLNAAGYGQPGTGLLLDLVYNPTGAFLPGPMPDLDRMYRKILGEEGLVFNQLLTINNMPIARFLDFLWESGNYDDYMERLIDAYNPAAVAGLMCKNTLSVAYDGRLFDCDFNQMLDMPMRGPVATLADWVAAGPEARAAMLQREVVTANHCYGCTAGAGSSCQGALT
jgi:radical SAM/Cys-rich protein